EPACCVGRGGLLASGKALSGGVTACVHYGYGTPRLAATAVWVLGDWDFGFVSDFDIRPCAGGSFSPLPAGERGERISQSRSAAPAAGPCSGSPRWTTAPGFRASARPPASGPGRAAAARHGTTSAARRGRGAGTRAPAPSS